MLIVLIGPLQFGGAAQSLGAVPNSFRPYFADYPNLSTAVMVFQLCVGASIAVWGYTAWALYQRDQGTLKTIQTSFLIGAVLRVFGSYSIALFGGLPPEASRSLVQQALPVTVFSVVMVSAWYLYLIRSERVREIYL